MDLEYLLRVVDAARKYGFNAIQICGATHGDVGNLDGITEFKRFARANEAHSSPSSSGPFSVCESGGAT